MDEEEQGLHRRGSGDRQLILFEYDDNKIYQILENKLFKSDEIISMCKEIDIYMPLSNVVINIIG